MSRLDCKNYKRDSLECEQCVLESRWMTGCKGCYKRSIDLFEHYKRRRWKARLTLSRVIAEEKSKES